MSYQPPEPPKEDRSVGEMVFDVSERVSTLIRDEIELAKAEITEKVQSLLRGGVVGIVAGTFAFLGLILLMHSIAWLLNDLFFGDHFWIGFLIEAVVFFATAAIAGYIASRRGAEGLASDPGSRDRGGPADQADARGRDHARRQGARDAPRPQPVAPPGQQPVTPPAQQPVTPPGPGARALSGEPEIYSGAGEPVAQPASGPPGRSSAQIRADVERQRAELSHSVEALRGRVAELTDWRRQVREHRSELIVGAAVLGFAVGGLIALRRRR